MEAAERATGANPVRGLRTRLACLLLPFLLSIVAPAAIAPSAIAQEAQSGLEPTDIWSEEYANGILPWGGNAQVQFQEYHDYESTKARMQHLADTNPDIISFHEGLFGGLNARGQETSLDDYKGWYHKNPSPWVKITAGVEDGDFNSFNGDAGNYPDRADVMLVGNHHAREWMSYEVPMLFLETVAHYYGQAGVDNDGDGLVDEDGWDGIDNDGDCQSLNASFQDSNGDGVPCGPGDLGVDEDFSEQFITDMVDLREIYLIPILNTDGLIYDQSEWLANNCNGATTATAYQECPRSGWRKNLRDNTVTGTTPIPDTDEDVNEGCDGVDLNRNYQYEWGAPLGATGPLVPGVCYGPAVNNDVYNGPPDDTDNDGDCVGAPGPHCVNEDHVDGKDDDADGLVDEDWAGGNSEPETKFIQDMTEMNDDNNDGASDFRATLTWHSFSELVLYPWGHCTDCESPDHEFLVYHGDQMAQMTLYENLQSSDLYPTTGDFCDWHYGVHGSYCYTMEIGNNFHENPADIHHIATRNLGVPFYMVEIADDPRFRAVHGLENMSARHWLQSPSEVEIPTSGDIEFELCLDQYFPFSINQNKSYLSWRFVEPTRQQDDFGPTEWRSVKWEKAPFAAIGEDCELRDGTNGTIISSSVPIPDTSVGKLQYRAQLGTTNGAFPFTYPTLEDGGNYYELTMPYRAGFGSAVMSVLMFLFIATIVWGGLGFLLRVMLDEDAPVLSLPPEEIR
tara:strand:+ start:366 stop:2570 length:2205 start_codon:yes stop_codon:yes gene_type:complete